MNKFIITLIFLLTLAFNGASRVITLSAVLEDDWNETDVPVILQFDNNEEPGNLIVYAVPSEQYDAYLMPRLLKEETMIFPLQPSNIELTDTTLTLINSHQQSISFRKGYCQLETHRASLQALVDELQKSDDPEALLQDEFFLGMMLVAQSAYEDELAKNQRGDIDIYVAYDNNYIDNCILSDVSIIWDDSVGDNQTNDFIYNYIRDYILPSQSVNSAQESDNFSNQTLTEFIYLIGEPFGAPAPFWRYKPEELEKYAKKVCTAKKAPQTPTLINFSDLHISVDGVTFNKALIKTSSDDYKNGNVLLCLSYGYFDPYMIDKYSNIAKAEKLLKIAIQCGATDVHKSTDGIYDYDMEFNIGDIEASIYADENSYGIFFWHRYQK